MINDVPMRTKLRALQIVQEAHDAIREALILAQEEEASGYPDLVSYTRHTLASTVMRKITSDASLEGSARMHLRAIDMSITLGPRSGRCRSSDCSKRRTANRACSTRYNGS